MKTLLPVLFVALAIALFIGFINPTYTAIKELRAEEGQYDQALTRSKELQQVRDKLLSRYNTFAQSDLARLEKFLPDTVDNVRLVLDLDSIATRYGMHVRNVSLESDQSRAARGAVGVSGDPWSSLIITFSVSGTYDTFRAFLADLEQSLRLTDITAISFSSNDSGSYDYNISLRTYWLNP